MINASVIITVSLAVPVLKGFELNFFKVFYRKLSSESYMTESQHIFAGRLVFCLKLKE